MYQQFRRWYYHPDRRSLRAHVSTILLILAIFSVSTLLVLMMVYAVEAFLTLVCFCLGGVIYWATYRLFKDY